MTGFLKEHPGGVAALSKPGRGGRDVTAHFNRVGHSDTAKQTMASLQVGVLSTAAVETLATDDNAAIRAAEDVARAVLTQDELEERAVKWHGDRRSAIM